ncbi:MAG TPA: hypothetical protein VLL75_16980 [Vicinamibacteria bacterium]|nr:hypothetical protein [Vicinamibacteria bacterium]
MRALRRSLLALAATALLAGQATPAFAARQVGEIEAPPASVGMDMVILRPMGLVATGVGAVLAVPATLVCLLTNPTQVHKPIDFLVMRPARYTFVDPIGSH